MNEGAFPFFWEYVPTDGYLYFRYTARGRVTQVVYSKKTKEMIFETSSRNDINSLFRYNNILTSMEGNVLVGYMQAYPIADVHARTLEQHSRSEIVEAIGEDMTQVADSIDSEDNPIILFFKIKDF
jgi:hypothetical protein